MNDVDILEQKAVNAAINQEWEVAIEDNKKILTIEAQNINALLRIGFAYMQSNNKDKAQEYYKKVIRLQPGNPVATENLEKIQILKAEGSSEKAANVRLNPNLFLEIPGKTKSISLVDVGQKKILANLVVGEEVIIKPKRRKIEIRTKTGEFIGYLPDDIAKRLLVFIEAESEYAAFIKEASINRVVVFIKEGKKGKKVQKYLSFSQSNTPSVLVVNRDEQVDDEEGESGEHDIEKLAEALTNEEKEEFPIYEEEEDEVEE